jgi:hypothetical protein
MADPMTEFVERGPMPVDRLEIGVGPGHLHIILRGAIEGAVTAEAEIGAGRGDQRLGLGQDQALGYRRRGRNQFAGKVLALIGAEHGETLEERNRTGFVTIALRPLAFLVGDEAIGIDDGGAAFALAHVAAKAQGLAKREPALAGEPSLDDGPPKNEDIDAGVATPRGRVLRHGERRFGRRRPPRLDPRHAAGFQLGDDLVGDFGIEARPVVAGASASG